jgi:SpoVK/Ycf46/Vps4 family AAA+-type ATPase
VSKGQLPSLLQALNGLSLKTSQEVVQLTMARTQTCTVQGIRGTRLMLGEATPGLHYLDTDADFYVMPKAVEEWLGLNSKYFLNPHTPPRLMPRGLLFVGVPGVGKTMAAQAIARHWKVPLFRLDVASGLTRWLGESEKQFQANLMALEQNAPCVALLDELEKLFVMGDDSPTMPRILSQLLWWLQTHKSPIITIMTSNDISRVPPELYRPGRIDKVVTLEKMTLTEAKSFATGVFKSILKTAPTLKQQKSMRDAIDDLSRSMAHAEVVDLVSEMIKERNWIEEVTSIDKAVS